MSKSKIGDGKKRYAVKRKNKIGNRKSIRGANAMSTDALRTFLEGPGRGRDKQKVRKVLFQRGAALTAE